VRLQQRGVPAAGEGNIGGDLVLGMEHDEVETVAVV
jgi:hypothetical protein